MIFLKLLGIVLMIGFVSLLRGLGEAVASVPMAEGWDEEEDFDDAYYFQIANGQVTEGSLVHKD